MKPVRLIAVHGNGGGAHRFARSVYYAGEVIRWESVTLPGFADQPLEPRLNSLADYADYLHGIVTRETGKPVLLGHGIGGSLVLEYLQRYAAHVTGVILHAPVGARLDRRWFPLLMKPRWVREMGKHLFAAPLMRPLLRRLLFTQEVPRRYLNQFFEEYRTCQAFSLMFDWIDAEWFSKLEPVSVPAVLLWGDKERVLRVEQIADFQKLLPEASVRRIPGWDHFPMIEQPREYGREIAELTREVATRCRPVSG